MPGDRGEHSASRRRGFGRHVAEMARPLAVRVVRCQEQAMEVKYDRVCAYHGALRFADAARDREIRDRIEAAYAPCLSGAVAPNTGHVDNNLFGILPFELFLQTGKYEYLPLAQYLADEEFADPRPDGLTRYTRFWADDMYMVGSLQAQALRVGHAPSVAERAVCHLLTYLAKLQRADGLIQHFPDTPIVWGRGCGWAAAGIAEVLSALPEGTPKRAQLLSAYRRLARALIDHQSEGGMWLQVVDRPEAWAETSGTGMFIFALATGVKEGWLEACPNLSAVERAWHALSTYLDSSGQITSTSIGVPPVGTPLSTYLEARQLANDFHGMAAVLWAATSLIAAAEDPSGH